MRTGYAVHVMKQYPTREHTRHDGYADILDASSAARNFIRVGCVSAIVTTDDDTVLYAYQYDRRERVERVRCSAHYAPRGARNVIFMGYGQWSTIRAERTNGYQVARRLCQAHMRRVQWTRANVLPAPIAERLARYTRRAA